MRRRVLTTLPILPPALGLALLFVLVWHSKHPAWGPVRAGSGQSLQPVPTQSIMESVELGPIRWLDPRIDLPLVQLKPMGPWSCTLMRLEKEMWRFMEREAPIPGARTLGELADEVNRGGVFSLFLEDDLLREIPVVALAAQGSFGDVLRATCDSAGVSVVPSERDRIFFLTRSLHPEEWPNAWPRVRVLKRLRGDTPDACERAWLALDRPALTVPEGPTDLAGLTGWIASETRLVVELSEAAARAAAEGLRLRFPVPEEGDTIESTSRLALAGSGLDVASKHGAILICTRGEADALTGWRKFTAPWTQEEWDEGVWAQYRLDRERVPLQGGKYVVANLIMRIANTWHRSGIDYDSPPVPGTPPAFADDVTWDDQTLIALPTDEYSVRELRELLWTCAGVRMHVLKGSLWFVIPENP